MESEDLSLTQILDICSNPDDPQWQNAWIQLLKRYKNLIYFFINKSCNGWQISRLNFQKNEVINDIFSEVLYLLHYNLDTFRNKESEKKFLSWLQIICNRSTSRYMQRILKDMLSEDNIEMFSNYRDLHSAEKSWELYENIVTMLREQLKNNKQSERDIHIFMLSAWSGFTPKQVSEHPLFSELKLNTIEVTISRIRKKLKNIMPM
jgi:DNA-directed RNA polymerase specialized sigma24 family protein